MLLLQVLDRLLIFFYARFRLSWGIQFLEKLVATGENDFVRDKGPHSVEIYNCLWQNSLINQFKSMESDELFYCLFIQLLSSRLFVPFIDINTLLYL